MVTDTTPPISSPALAATRVLVSDFDGTITAHDFFDLACRYLLPDGAIRYWRQYQAHEISHFEALAGMFSMIRGPETAVREVVARAEPDPYLADDVAALQVAGWQLVIASAGCQWYIRQILDAAGVPPDSYTLHTNPGRYSPTEGLIMSRAVDAPFYGCETGIDKAAVVADAQRRASLVAYAGDGRADVEALCRVGADWRFARLAAAAELTARGEGFRPFDRWHQVATALRETPDP